MFLTHGLATALTKLTSAGIAAKTATGLAVAAVAVTGAAAADALPTPAQNTMAHLVATVSPLTLPHADEATTGTSTTTTTDTTTTTGSTTTGSAGTTGTGDTGTATATDGATPPATPSHDNFGGTISRMAHRHGGVNGQTVRTLAHADHRDAHAQHDTTGSANTTGTDNAGTDVQSPTGTGSTPAIATDRPGQAHTPAAGHR